MVKDWSEGRIKAKLETLLDELQRHIALEEYDLFPDIAKSFGDDH